MKTNVRVLLSAMIVTASALAARPCRASGFLIYDISGQALRGQVTAILGPNDAGKSTFLDALAGRIAKGSLEGSVSIDGRSVRATSSQ